MKRPPIREKCDPGNPSTSSLRLAQAISVTNSPEKNPTYYPVKFKNNGAGSVSGFLAKVGLTWVVSRFKIKVV